MGYPREHWQSAERRPNEWVCPHCGSYNDEDSRNCWSCDHDQDGNPPPATEEEDDDDTDS